MDNEQSCIENKVEDIVPIKPRLSLFNPNLQTESKDAELIKSENQVLTSYREKLISEREQWKHIYKDLKDSNQCLKKKLENNTSEEPYYSILNEEDLQHANDRPNFYEFTKQVKELQEQAQICEVQLHKLKNQKQHECRNLKLQIDLIEQECFDNSHFAG